MDMSQWLDWYWFVIGTVLIVLEVFVFGAVLLWLGIAAILMGIITIWWPGVPWQTQLWVYMIIAAVTLALGLWMRKKFMGKPREQLVNVRMHKFAGERGILDTPIVAGRGSMKMGDTVWPVKGPDMPAGTVVVVTGFDGTNLTIAKLEHR